MLLTTRSVIGLGVLAISCSLEIGASSAQAQALGSAQAQAPRYYTPASVYTSPAPRYCYVPAPVYTYSTPRYYVPAPAYSSSAQGDSPPRRSYSYYDQDGVEHDSRYPHWSFDYKSWIVYSLH
jgi:hypothetical protein